MEALDSAFDMHIVNCTLEDHFLEPHFCLHHANAQTGMGDKLILALIQHLPIPVLVATGWIARLVL